MNTANKNKKSSINKKNFKESFKESFKCFYCKNNICFCDEKFENPNYIYNYNHQFIKIQNNIKK
jgi:hypothetical protein